MLAPELEQVLADLVAEARAEGGIDNITAILADVVESGGTDGAVVLGAAADHRAPVAPAPTAAAPADASHGGHDRPPRWVQKTLHQMSL